MALARTAGISHTAIRSALSKYQGLAHRSQWVAEINGVNWINDSKATNPGATLAAIEGIDEPVILIAGGQGKGADMGLLCNVLKKHVKRVLLFGEDAGLLQSSWQGCSQLERVENMQQAVHQANKLAQTGDIVLLSPACASFDQYSGFAARGEHFSQLVRALV
jgi:UDP-N-acetylmuramoylalanine--D-glutamate ligase